MDEIEIEGTVRDLRHLQAFTVTLAGKGKGGADLRVAVSLGCHTVSRSCDLGEHDMADENGKPRKFCEDRYAFSMGLPDLLKDMVEQNYSCWESLDRNRAMNYAIIDADPGQATKWADGDYWVVYFYLYPCLNGDADISLIVTSCHERTMVFRNIKRRYSVHQLLRTCLYGGKRIP